MINFFNEYWIIVVGTILRLSATRDYCYVLRRAMSEAGVKNGLEKLRQKLLISAVIMLTINLTALIFIIIRPLTSTVVFQNISAALIIINSIGFFLDARLKKQMYGEQYTPQQKEFHKKVQRLDKKQEERDVRREVARVKLNKDRRDLTKARKKNNI